MQGKKKRFIEILRIELDDLHDDIEALAEHCTELRRARELSEIGYWGNLGVLKNELRGVGVFAQIMNDADPDQYDSLESLAQDLEDRLLASIEKYGMVPAIDVLIRRKIDKVQKFVEEQS